MGVESGAEYVLSAYVRAQRRWSPAAVGAAHGRAGTASRRGDTHRVHAANGSDTRRRCGRPATHAPRAARDCAEGQGEIDIDMVSLYPKETWKNRPNGLRKDLVQLLADMKPGFIRFPGGCIVEGRRLELRYDWKKTVGDVSERKAHRQPVERRVRPQADAGLLPVVRARVLRVLPARRGRRRDARCRSSTAGWRASSIRARRRRSTRSIRSSRTRSI